MIIKKLIKFATNQDYRFLVLAGKGMKANMPADAFLKKMYIMLIFDDSKSKSSYKFSKKRMSCLKFWIY